MLTIPQHKTQIDLAVEHFGTVQALFDSALLNDSSITDDLIPGNTWITPEVKYEQAFVVIPPAVAQPDVQIIKKHQELSDFTTQYAGTLSSLFEMAKLNGLSITDEVAPGMALKINKAELKVARYYANAGIDVVSTKKVSELKPGGVGYMQIGNDFKVS